MKITTLIVLAYLFSFFSFTYSQEFSGSYFIQTNEGGVSLSFEKGEGNQYYGKMNGNGILVDLQGTVVDGVLKGTVGNGIVFSASFQNNSLKFLLADTDQYGNTIPSSIQTIIFPVQKQNVLSKPKTQKTNIVINGTKLSTTQVRSIQNQYGIKPKPGKYWYDTVSGLYGVVGYAAFGYMYPGHQFGQINRNASNGNTNVIINGREIPQQEWAVWSYMVGSWILPGSYWLDSKGNAGYQGNPIPLVNLYTAAKQNAYRGKGGSGDNFWSSRFGAGNSNADNSQGYVSVPGYGPIGYGF